MHHKREKGDDSSAELNSEQQHTASAHEKIDKFATFCASHKYLCIPATTTICDMEKKYTNHDNNLCIKYQMNKQCQANCERESGGNTQGEFMCTNISELDDGGECRKKISLNYCA